MLLFCQEVDFCSHFSLSAFLVCLFLSVLLQVWPLNPNRSSWHAWSLSDSLASSKSSEDFSLTFAKLLAFTSCVSLRPKPCFILVLASWAFKPYYFNFLRSSCPAYQFATNSMFSNTLTTSEFISQINQQRHNAELLKNKKNYDALDTQPTNLYLKQDIY